MHSSLPIRPFAPGTRLTRTRALLGIALTLALLAAPWWPQVMASGMKNLPSMAICSVGGSGANGAPLPMAAGHCQLCCGNLSFGPTPALHLPTAAVAAISYPVVLPLLGRPGAGLMPGNPRARAPPRV